MIDWRQRHIQRATELQDQGWRLVAENVSNDEFILRSRRKEFRPDRYGFTPAERFIHHHRGRAMTHEEAIDAALNVFWPGMADLIGRVDMSSAVAAYIEARGAVLCEAKPAGWGIEGLSIIFDSLDTATRECAWFSPTRKVVAIYTALQDSPPQGEQS